jgi:hypothetical protein
MEVAGTEEAVLGMSSRGPGRGPAAELLLLLLLGGPLHLLTDSSGSRRREWMTEGVAVQGGAQLLVHHQGQAAVTLGGVAGRVHQQQQQQQQQQLPVPNAKPTKQLLMLHGNDTWHARSSRQRGFYDSCGSIAGASWRQKVCMSCLDVSDQPGGIQPMFCDAFLCFDLQEVHKNTSCREHCLDSVGEWVTCVTTP